MSKYKGYIKNFPDEVVEWMCDQQVKQGNPRDISVFERKIDADGHEGGFKWLNTEEGYDFCFQVIGLQNFDLILKNLQKPTQASTFDEHRFQAALAAMTGLLNNGKLNHPAAIATEAVELADELLAALKGGTEYQKLKKELERVDKKQVEIPYIDTTTYND